MGSDPLRDVLTRLCNKTCCIRNFHLCGSPKGRAIGCRPRDFPPRSASRSMLSGCYLIPSPFIFLRASQIPQKAGNTQRIKVGCAILDAAVVRFTTPSGETQLVCDSHR